MARRARLETEEASAESSENKTGTRCFARAYHVFNADQVDGFTIPQIPQLPDAERIERAEVFFRNTGARIIEKGGRACFSPEGRKGAPGTLEKPLGSLMAARNAIRNMRSNGMTGHVTVLLRGGVYFLPETFILTPHDSDVTYSAYPNERPVLSGGRKIISWKKGSGPVWTASCSGQVRQLFVNGRRVLRARIPANGFYRTDGPSSRIPANGFYRTDGPSSQAKPFVLKFRGNDIRKDWARLGDVEVVVLLAWSEIRMPIRDVDEAAHIARPFA